MFKNGDVKLSISTMSSIVDQHNNTNEKHAKIVFSYNAPEYIESSNIEYSYDIW